MEKTDLATRKHHIVTRTRRKVFHGKGVEPRGAGGNGEKPSFLAWKEQGLSSRTSVLSSDVSESGGRSSFALPYF